MSTPPPSPQAASEQVPSDAAAPEGADTARSSPRQRFLTLVSRLAHELDGSHEAAIPAGELATLRREDGALSPAFYKLAARVLEDELARYAYEPLRVEAERRWARVVHALAKLGGQHRPGAPSFGRALAAAELAEPRFLRLVRAEGDALDAALRAAIAPLAQKAVSFDAADLAALVLSAPHPTWSFYFDDGEAVRRRIARDYYRAQRATDQGAS
jgi:CRISPR type I-E-associated protein CasB/Cse2